MKLAFITCLTAGQVLTRQNIEDVIKFAKRENLLILADEVPLVTMYQILTSTLCFCSQHQ